MGRYTYTLNPNRIETERQTYKQSELEKMTTFHLREICRKERLVIPSGIRPGNFDPYFDAVPWPERVPAHPDWRRGRIGEAG